MHPPRTTTGASTGGPSPGRRSAVLGAVALGCLACLAAVAVPLALLTGRHEAAPEDTSPSGAPVAPSTSRSQLHGTLTADLDGDGLPDHVSLRPGGMLRARLASGLVARRLLPDEPRLEGLADVGAPAPVVVTSSRRSDGRAWSMWRVQGQALVRVPVSGSSGSDGLDALAGSSVTWLSEQPLYDGTLDPLQRGQEHVAVMSRQWALVDGRLVPRAAGIRCWDRSSDLPPTTCAPGQDWTYDVGPHGDLPTLLPPDSRGVAPQGRTTTSDGDLWTLRASVPRAPAAAAWWSLRVSGRVPARSARMPSGSAPALFRTPVRVGDLTEGVLLRQEGGDAWRVYVDWGGRIQEVPTRGPVPLGGGVAGSHPEVAYLSWMGADGSLYTRVGEGRPGRYRVYAWRPEDISAATAPTLVADDLGTVCIDETLGTYGTCPHAKRDRSA